MSVNSCVGPAQISFSYAPKKEKDSCQVGDQKENAASIEEKGKVAGFPAVFGCAPYVPSIKGPVIVKSERELQKEKVDDLVNELRPGCNGDKCVFNEDQSDALDDLFAMGELAVPFLLEKIKDDPDEIVRQIVTMVLVDNEELAVPGLLGALKDKAFEKQWSAIQGILLAIGKPAVPLLVASLKQETDRRIAGVLVGIGEEAVSDLIALLKDPNKVVRCFVIQLFGQIKSKKAVSSLTEVVENECAEGNL